MDQLLQEKQELDQEKIDKKRKYHAGRAKAYRDRQKLFELNLEQYNE